MARDEAPGAEPAVTFPADPGRSQRSQRAMLKMQKIDAEALEDAANGS